MKKNIILMTIVMTMISLFISCGDDTPTDTGSSVVPDAASVVTFSAVTANSATISWIDNSDNELGFNVYMSPTTIKPATATGSVGANVTSYSASGLSADTAYNVWVIAYNSIGESTATIGSFTTTTNAAGSSSSVASSSSSVASSSSSSTSSAGTAPNAPTSFVAANPTASVIELTWVDASSDEDEFVIYYSNADTQPTAIAASLPANSTSYNVTGLTAATAYYFWIKAKNTAGSSAVVGSVTATTLADVSYYIFDDAHTNMTYALWWANYDSKTLTVENDGVNAQEGTNYMAVILSSPNAGYIVNVKIGWGPNVDTTGYNYFKFYLKGLQNTNGVVNMKTTIELHSDAGANASDVATNVYRSADTVGYTEVIVDIASVIGSTSFDITTFSGFMLYVEPIGGVSSDMNLYIDSVRLTQ